MFFSQSLIGIDIGTSSVKVCELDRGGTKLLRLGVDVFQAQAVIDGEIKDLQHVSTTLLNLFKKIKLNPKGRRASIGINGSGILIKRTLIQPEQGNDIIEQASYEASQSFPYEIDDLYTRFANLGPPYQDGRIPMALVGAKRDLVEQYISLTHSVGLKTGVLDCGALAIANMFDLNYPVEGAMIVIVNVGNASTQVIISYSGEFLYTREIQIGGRDYNQRICESIDVDYDNAETLKISASMGDQAVTEELSDILEDNNEAVAREVLTTINFFFENEDYPPNMTKNGYVFLVGGSARLIGLDAALAANLQMPVQIANPFHRLNIKASPYEPEYLMNQGPLFGTAVGLAMRKFNET